MEISLQEEHRIKYIDYYKNLGFINFKDIMLVIKPKYYYLNITVIFNPNA
jgi:hypothetical protein